MRRSSCRIRSTRSTKARRCWPAPGRYCVNADPAADFAHDWSARARRRLGAHAAAVRLLARQSDRPRARPRRLAHAVRALRPLRLRHRVRRVLFGGLFRRGAAAAGRARRRAGAGTRRLSAPRRVRQPVEALERAGTALRLRRRRCAAARRRSCCTARITAARCRGAVAAASIAAWNDEAHVRANRAEYAAKFAALQPRLAAVAAVRDARGRVLPVGADARSTTPSSRGGSTPRRT